MENISRKDISLRLGNLKNKVNEISENISKNKEDFESKCSFANDMGIKLEGLFDIDDQITNGLENYIKKTDEIIQRYSETIEESEEDIEEYKLLNNMLYLDDIKLKNIKELVNENKDIKTREYINLIATKANDLIREEELKDINSNIIKYSKITFVDKLTGRTKLKRALAECYSLKRVETINKKYVPDNRSIYEIASITNNCGYKSDSISVFLNKLVKEYDLGELGVTALTIACKQEKIPFFYNKNYLKDLNMKNANMLDRINSKKKIMPNISERELFKDLLIKDITTLELLKFNYAVLDNTIEEVIK